MVQDYERQQQLVVATTTSDDQESEARRRQSMQHGKKKKKKRAPVYEYTFLRTKLLALSHTGQPVDGECFEASKCKM